MSVRDIIHHLRQVYGTELSPATISAITDAVLEEVKAWQPRPLVKPPGLRGGVPGRHRGQGPRRPGRAEQPAYVAVGVDADGEKHVLGIWLPRTPAGSPAEGEGARFWGGVMADLKNRGVRDILIACVDGLAGFAGAVTAAFPATVVQRCVVHLIRNSLRPVARRDPAQVAAELRKASTVPTAEAC